MIKTSKVLLAAAIAAVPSAVLAGTAPIPVPEPTTMGLVAVATAGMAVAYRIMRR